LHHQLSVVITAESVGPRACLQLRFANAGERVVKVTDVAPFARVTHSFAGDLSSQRSTCKWPQSIVVHRDPLPLAVPPGAVSGYSISVEYDLPLQEGRAVGRGEVVDHFVRIESEDRCGELRMTSLKYTLADGRFQ
jgi:hypothetical protein